eukprot:CAMPEP_0114976888 /NCGR_PEP_ID=MMETSP0216-20121206/2926_1 /TAXON_ID=223996 /ORGANISM="Protocruzia adherens, Strain Boccale" /LENGTH=67 /DNA_ID=CAMNT_0002337873 /DNA_START=40 /DNA_END=243 /DNA_ORIENTATION=+
MGKYSGFSILMYPFKEGLFGKTLVIDSVKQYVLMGGVIGGVYTATALLNDAKTFDEFGRDVDERRYK